MKEFLIFIMCIAAGVFILVFFYNLEDERVRTTKEKEIAVTKALMFQAEVGYYEGQKDALEGDIRIEKIYGTDSSYRWSKSPWDGEVRKPMYNPQDGMTVNVDNMMNSVRREINK